jgi:hypothetical protein
MKKESVEEYLKKQGKIEYKDFSNQIIGKENYLIRFNESNISLGSDFEKPAEVYVLVERKTEQKPTWKYSLNQSLCKIVAEKFKIKTEDSDKWIGYKIDPLIKKQEADKLIDAVLTYDSLLYSKKYEQLKKTIENELEGLVNNKI